MRPNEPGFGLPSGHGRLDKDRLELRCSAFMINTVAVATDGSVTASRAVDEAAELAKRWDAKLVQEGFRRRRL